MNKRILLLTGTLLVLAACAGISAQQSSGWTQFVQVDGQPEPVPAEWVATPEGKFAHSIKVPNPVPKDSVYKPWMSSEAYFKHLCEKEAGEFIFKTVENVDGFYFMRPPKRPTDDDLRSLYQLEDPATERVFQLREPTPQERAKIFINPPWANFKFVEEPTAKADRFGRRGEHYRMSGYRQADKTPMRADMGQGTARYGLVWRGLKRPVDRENRIAGGELIVLDLDTNAVLAVRRNFVFSPKMKNVDTRIWWLNATSCGAFPSNDDWDSQFLYKFTSKVLVPASGDKK